MRSTLLLVALTLALTPTEGTTQAAGEVLVEFFKEEITLAVDDSCAHIIGVYFFRNCSENDIDFRVSYPFYVDDACHYPFSIRAYRVQNGDTLTIDYTAATRPNSIRLVLPLPAQGVLRWGVEYTQNILERRATYILSTTQVWGRPFEQATYTFVAPQSFEIIDTWPKPDSADVQGGHQVLTANRTEFMPRRDMEIRWRSK